VPVLTVASLSSRQELAPAADRLAVAHVECEFPQWVTLRRWALKVRFASVTVIAARFQSARNPACKRTKG
jgi:hypothetical protein